MKKFALIICTSFAVSVSLHAQTFAEWFAQKKTQIKYLIDQIAAYQVYTGYLEKGYGIVEKGLATIHDIKNGEFNLHNDFFNSLKTVNPEIAKYSKVADIIFYQTAVVRDFKQILQIKIMSAAELSYLNSVYNKMMSECAKSLNELIDLITNNALEMTDDQRIKRIDTIWLNIKEIYGFTLSFTAEAQVLAAQRQDEQNDVEMSLINNGLK